MTNNSQPTVIAERPSTCPDCFSFINIGDGVTRSNAFEEWRHVRCPRTKFEFDPAAVCPNCFTVRTLTGACNCA